MVGCEEVWLAPWLLAGSGLTRSVCIGISKPAHQVVPVDHYTVGDDLVPRVDHHQVADHDIGVWDDLACSSGGCMGDRRWPRTRGAVEHMAGMSCMLRPFSEPRTAATTTEPVLDAP